MSDTRRMFVTTTDGGEVSVYDLLSDADQQIAEWREKYNSEHADREAAEAKAGELAALLDEALDAMIGKVSAPVIRSIIAKRNGSEMAQMNRKEGVL